MKDHEKRELVNRLTKIASEYAHTQQLRERIAHELLSSIESDSSFAAQAAAWRSLVEWICTATTTVDMPDLALPIGITYNTLRTYFERAGYRNAWLVVSRSAPHCGELVDCIRGKSGGGAGSAGAQQHQRDVAILALDDRGSQAGVGQSRGYYWRQLHKKCTKRRK